jgi:hypothetical protein
MILLSIVDEVPLSPGHQASGLCFIIQYCSEVDVFGDWFPPVRVGAGRPDNGHYFCPELPGLTKSPDRGP